MTVVEGTRIGPAYHCLTEKRAIKLQAALKQLWDRDDVEITRTRAGLLRWRVEATRWRPIKEDTAQTHDHREAA